MTIILAIDTATDYCGVALDYHGEITEQSESQPRQHQQRLLAMIDAVLQSQAIDKSAIDAIALSCGPGSFTGLRIGAATAQGLSLAIGCPIAMISTLAILAQTGFDMTGNRDLIAGLDARMSEIYWGRYRYSSDLGIVQKVAAEMVSAPQDITVVEQGSWQCVGPAWSIYADQLSETLTSWQKHPLEGLTHTKSLLKLAAVAVNNGQVVAAEDAIPVYIRNKVTQ